MPTAPPPPPADNPYLSNCGPVSPVGEVPPSHFNYGRGGSPIEQYRVTAGYSQVTNQGNEGSQAGTPPMVVADPRGGGALPLPPGWEALVLPGGRTMFMDHNSQVLHRTVVPAKSGNRRCRIHSHHRCQVILRKGRVFGRHLSCVNPHDV